MFSQPEFIRPTFLNNESISSWFSLKNPELVTTGQRIPGLNVGMNTSENLVVVQRNREILSNTICTDVDNICFANQIHQSNVLQVVKGEIYNDVDAFVTTKKGLALAIQVADCAAVLLGDPLNQVIGAAHAGWRGAVAGIVPKTISKMEESGADPANMKAYISPCISARNFEVGSEVAAQFPSHLVNHTDFSKPHVNLKLFIVEQLLSKGIAAENIEMDELCTMENADSCYSYRREKEQSGRMAGIIKLNERATQ